MVSSEYQEIAQHLKRVLDDVELTSRHFVPFDRNFCNGDPELFGEQEKFDVEYPCCKVLKGEYLLCSASREQLEAALGITDMSNADYAEDGMKPIHEDVSKERPLSRGANKPTRQTTQKRHDIL